MNADGVSARPGRREAQARHRSPATSPAAARLPSARPSSIPIITKNTTAFIGNSAHVNAKGVQRGRREDRRATPSTNIDPRFKAPTAITGGNTINIGYAHGWSEDQEVLLRRRWRHRDQRPHRRRRLLRARRRSRRAAGPAASCRRRPTSTLRSPRSSASPAAPARATASSRRTRPACARTVAAVRPAASGAIVGNTITLPYSFSKDEEGTTSAVALQDDDAVVYSSGGGHADRRPRRRREVLRDSVTTGTRSSAAPRQEVDATAARSSRSTSRSRTGRSHSIVPSGTQPVERRERDSVRASSPPPRRRSAASASPRRTATTLATVGISAGFAGTAAVNIAGAVDVVEHQHDGHIGENGVDQLRRRPCATNVTRRQRGAVACGSPPRTTSTSSASPGSIAIGGTAGVAVPVGVRVVNLNTDACIGNNTKVNARDDISVTADRARTRSSRSSRAPAAARSASPAASASSILNDAHLRLHRFDTCTLNAGGNVLVSATDDTKLLFVQIGIAGGYVGVGAAVGVATFDKDTQAFIGSNSVVNGQGQRRRACTAIHERRRRRRPASRLRLGADRLPRRRRPGDLERGHLRPHRRASAAASSASAGGVGVTLITSSRRRSSAATRRSTASSPAATRTQSVSIGAVDSVEVADRRRRRRRRLRRRRAAASTSARSTQSVQAQIGRLDRARAEGRRRLRALAQGRADLRALDRRRVRRRRGLASRSGASARRRPRPSTRTTAAAAPTRARGSRARSTARATSSTSAARSTTRARRRTPVA